MYLILAEIAKTVGTPSWVVWLAYTCEALELITVLLKAHDD